MIAWGQSEPFKGANTLVIKSNQVDLFKSVGRALVEDGFEIKDLNEDFGTITTEWKSMSQTASYRLVASIKGDEISISGKFINHVGNAVFNSTGMDYEIYWNKKGPMNYMWGLIDSFGSKFGAEKKYFKK